MLRQKEMSEKSKFSKSIEKQEKGREKKMIERKKSEPYMPR